MANIKKFMNDRVKRVLMKEFLRSEILHAGYGGIDISRSALGTRVTIKCENPGLVIGKKGNTIKKLTSDINEKFQIENPQIAVEEEKNPDLNANVMAEKLANALERGWQFKRAAHSTARRIMQAGARGCLIKLSGKLSGERHRTEKIREGFIKYCGHPAEVYVDKGYVPAMLKPGVLGVTVWIMKKDIKLPDEIFIKKSEEEIKKEENKIHVNMDTKQVIDLENLSPPIDDIIPEVKEGKKR